MATDETAEDARYAEARARFPDRATCPVCAEPLTSPSPHAAWCHVGQALAAAWHAGWMAGYAEAHDGPRLPNPHHAEPAPNRV